MSERDAPERAIQTGVDWQTYADMLLEQQTRLFTSKFEELHRMLAKSEQVIGERLDGIENAAAERLRVQENAIVRADSIAATYKADSNEWRGALRDLQSTYPSKETVDASLRAIENAHREVKENLDGRLRVTEAQVRDNTGLITSMTKKAESDTAWHRWLIPVLLLGLASMAMNFYLALR